MAAPTQLTFSNERIAHGPTETAPKRIRTVVVDDSPTFLQVTCELLELDPLIDLIARAGKGGEAIETVWKLQPDLVLMDVHMPKMDGFQATAAIREKEKTTGSRVPIIAMTGYAMKGDRQRCIDAGMDGYICKPIRSQELYEVIEAATAQDKNLKIDLAPLLLDNE